MEALDPGAAALAREAAGDGGRVIVLTGAALPALAEVIAAA